MRYYKPILFLTILSVFSFSVGCDKRPEGFPKLVPCDLTVTKGGEPLAGAVLILSPISGGGEWISSAKTDTSGKAVLKTSMKDYVQTGVPEGDYRVVVSKRVDVEYEMSPEEASRLSPSELTGLQQRYEKRMEEARIVPAVFESAMLSPAQITVSSSNSQYQFDLNDYKTE